MKCQTQVPSTRHYFVSSYILDHFLFEEEEIIEEKYYRVIVDMKPKSVLLIYLKYLQNRLSRIISGDHSPGSRIFSFKKILWIFLA